MKINPLFYLFIILLAVGCGDDDENLSSIVNERLVGTWVAESVDAEGTITTTTSFGSGEITTVAEIQLDNNTLDFTLTFTEGGGYSAVGDYSLDAYIDVDATDFDTTSITRRVIEFTDVINQGDFSAGRDGRLNAINNLFTLRVDSRLLFNVNEPQQATYEIQGDNLTITRNQTTEFVSTQSNIRTVSTSVSTWRKR